MKSIMTAKLIYHLFRARSKDLNSTQSLIHSLSEQMMCQFVNVSKISEPMNLNAKILTRMQ